ncbi:hypothetical protein FFA01_21570 [Frigoribacterium faeni]|uniref:Uncharacterized protein n=1 Tax=Frigoribacterium faeni TaxID=145483 RepID=A0ABQ0UQU9_9MICO|nr:hypothetical protein GCM10025699_44330 [Microbacterium flavescens]GEK83848.1 hypothetical protein FFA01_21570 [Frigoribacterium faeni]
MTELAEPEALESTVENVLGVVHLAVTDEVDLLRGHALQCRSGPGTHLPHGNRKDRAAL